MGPAAHPEPGATQAGSAAPFRLTPDLKYIFLSRCHAAAASALDGAISAGSRIIAFAGEPGTGKTTLLARLRSDPRHADRTIVYCPYPALSLGALLQEFMGAADATAAAQAESPEAIAKRLAKRHRGRRLILIVDDATRCPPRPLTDLWSVAEALAKASSTLQVILAASPTFCQELDRILVGAGMPAAAHVELPPMDVEDVGAYVRHRMAVAGLSGDVFSAAALAEIAQYSLGMARVVNQICSRALMLSEWRREHPISRRLVVEAITDCPIDALVAPRAADAPADSRAAAPTVPDAPAAEERATPAPAAAEAATPTSEGTRPESPPSTVDDVPAPPLAAAAAEPIPEPTHPENFASAEIEGPAPPSAAARATEPAADGEPPPPAAVPAATAERPVGRDSWALREAARRRRRTRGDLLRPPGDEVQAPRFAGFVARRGAPPVVRNIASPGPIAPALLAPHRSKWWPWAAGAVLVVVAAAMLLQRQELVVRIERALPPQMQGWLTPVSEQATAGMDAVLRALRSAYRQEPPRS